MSLPIVDLEGDGSSQLLDALVEHGAVFVRAPDVPAERFDRAAADIAAFFALPDPDLAELAIERSPHFRGYSVMHNERDWREQVHFGREMVAVDSDEPSWRLQGPNLWPASAGWRASMTEWIDTTEAVGHRALDAIAAPLGFDSGAWLGTDPYLVVKLIAYHPQDVAREVRPGVAPHLDFSLVTMTMQDEVGGLQVLGRSGAWVDVDPVPGTWLLHAGELLQYVTGNRVVATPHRVVNRSFRRTRFSMPLFVCPALVVTLHRPGNAAPIDVPPDGEHVHAVLDPAAPPPSIPFGPAEWHRKGEDVWCRTCCR